MPKVNIDVKNKGILEVPKDKKVDELPLKHFEDLVDKKGYDKIIKALNNLQVWNKNDDKELSKWAEDTMEALKKKFRPENSSKNKHYIVHEFIGNHSDKVFESDDFYEVQDYLEDRWVKYCEDEKVGLDDEKERELFDSYFHIEEKEVEDSTKKTRCSYKVDTDLDKYVGIGYEHCIINPDTALIAKDYGFEVDEAHNEYWKDNMTVHEYEDEVRTIFFIGNEDNDNEVVLLHATPREAFEYALKGEIENSMIDDSEAFKVGEVVRHKITGKDYLIHDFYNEDEDEGGFYQVLDLEELETGEESTQPAIDFERISDKDFKEKYPEYYVGSSKEEFKIGDKVRIKAYPEKVYTVQDFDGETYKLKELGFSRYSKEELELACDKMKLSKVAKALSKVGIETSAKEDEETLNTVTKSKVRKALDAIFPACDKDIRFPEKAVLNKEIFKENLDKNKKHEYLAQSSKVAKALNMVNTAKTTKEVSENMWQVLKPLGFEKLNKRTFTKDFDEGFVDDFGSVYTRCLIETRDNGETFIVTKYERNPKYTNGKAEVMKIVSSLSEAVDIYKEFVKDKAISSKVAKALNKIK